MAGLATAALMVPSVLGAVPARGENLTALYSVSFLGFSIARASLDMQVDRGSYSANLHIRTAGIARIISSEESFVNVKGYLGRNVVPSAYDLFSRGDQVTQVTMTLGAGNVRSVNAIPELAERADRVPVTAAAKRNVVDPLSALMVPVAPRQDAKAVCDRTLPIFDGWTRYDIKLSYTGTEPVEFAGFKGDAIQCAARWVPIAGHREGQRSTEFMRDNKDLAIWFVPGAGKRVLIPYRVSVQTMRGRLTVQATQFGAPADDAKPRSGSR